MLETFARALGATTALALFVAPAAAQSTRTSLNTYANATFVANGHGWITGPELNVGVISLIAAAGFLNDTNVWLGANTFNGAVTFGYFPTFPGFVATGGSTAATFADRATDGGVTFNLKSDFGAACDGSTDDTTAIQAWLAKAGPGVRLVAPGGTCRFSSPLTVGAASHYTLAGAGPQTTIFRYTGASTTATPLTINAPNAVGVAGIQLSGFRMQSATTMTGGFAIQINGMFASVLDDVSVDQPAYGDALDGNFCGGIWFNGVGGVDYTNPNLYSTQKCGDGIKVNANLGGTAELRVVGGGIQGFAVGGHMAGGFGGFRFDGTDIALNGGGILIDTAQVAINNREFGLGPNTGVDTNDNYGVKINDSLVSGGTVDLGGWIGSTSGHGVEIDAWANGDVEIHGDKVYNNCGSGVFVNDATTKVRIAASTVINNNNASLGSLCTTWKAANPGHGYGVEAGVSTANIWSAASIPTQTGGVAASNANAHIQNWSQNASGVTVLSSPAGNAGFALNAASGSSAAVEYFEIGGAAGWGVGQDTSGFEIWDYANSGYWAFHCASGGSCSLGEGDASALTVLGAQEIKVTGASANAKLTLTETNGGSGGAGALIYFKDNATYEWEIGKDTDNTFRIWDNVNSSYLWLKLTTGGNATIGEQNSNVLTLVGSIAAKAGATPTASGSCAVTNQTGGQIAGSFKANGACSGGTVVLTFAATQANGWACDAHDETTPADLMNQTAHTTTSATFTGTMAANDVVVWKCIGF